MFQTTSQRVYSSISQYHPPYIYIYNTYIKQVPSHQKCHVMQQPRHWTPSEPTLGTCSGGPLQRRCCPCNEDGSNVATAENGPVSTGKSIFLWDLYGWYMVNLWIIYGYYSIGWFFFGKNYRKVPWSSWENRNGFRFRFSLFSQPIKWNMVMVADLNPSSHPVYLGGCILDSGG